MKEWEEYYLDRLISAYSLYNKYNDILEEAEKNVVQIEEQISRIFGKEKAEEIFQKYLEYAEQLEQEK